MERLTMKNSDGTYSQPTHLTFEKMFYKLASFEDLCDQYNIEDLGHLDIMLFVLSGETKYRLKEIQQENQALKDRWDKLKEWVANTKPLRGTNIYFLQETLLEKMQELESKHD